MGQFVVRRQRAFEVRVSSVSFNAQEFGLHVEITRYKL